MIWTVRFLDDGKTVRLAWRLDNFAEVLGIKGTIPPIEMAKFCEAMKGKEINLVLESDFKEVPNLGSMSDEDLMKLTRDSYHRYPFYECAEEESLE